MVSLGNVLETRDNRIQLFAICDYLNILNQVGLIAITFT